MRQAAAVGEPNEVGPCEVDAPFVPECLQQRLRKGNVVAFIAGGSCGVAEPLLVDTAGEREDGVWQAECGVCELGLGFELGGGLALAVEGEDEGGGVVGGVEGKGEEVGSQAAG